MSDFRVMAPGTGSVSSLRGHREGGGLRGGERSGMGIFATLDSQGRAAPTVVPRRRGGGRTSRAVWRPARFEAVSRASGSPDTTRATRARWWAASWPVTVPTWVRHWTGCGPPTHVCWGGARVPGCAGVASAWGEETLGYLHQLSCEDPLTGLASLASPAGQALGGLSRRQSRGDVDRPPATRWSSRPPRARGRRPGRSRSRRLWAGAGSPRPRGLVVPRGGDHLPGQPPGWWSSPSEATCSRGGSGCCATWSRTSVRRPERPRVWIEGCRSPARRRLRRQAARRDRASAARGPVGVPAPACRGRPVTGTSLAPCAAATRRAGSPRTSSRSSRSALRRCRT